MAARGLAVNGRSRTVFSSLARRLSNSQEACLSDSVSFYSPSVSKPGANPPRIGTLIRNPKFHCSMTQHPILSPSRALATSTSVVSEVRQASEEASEESKDSPPESQQQAAEEDVSKGGEGDELDINEPTGEVGGPKGPEPTRYGDWEKGGRCFDF